MADADYHGGRLSDTTQPLRDLSFADRELVVSTADRLAIHLSPGEIEGIVAKAQSSRSAVKKVRETPGLEVEPAVSFVVRRSPEPE